MTIFRDNRELLRAFREGRREGLEAVYWEYINLVVTVVRRGSKGSWQLDYDEQRDVVQETFSRAFEEKTRLAFDGIHDYRPFLMAICRNVLVDSFRKRGREVPADLTVGENDELVAQGDEVPDDAWADPSTVAVVEEYVQGLNPVLRKVYDLRYVKSRSQVQTATTMRLSRQKIRTLEKRLRKGLERALKKAGVG